MDDKYLTLKSPSEGLYKEKGSKFLGFAFPVKSEEEIKEQLEYLRKKEHAARHHCYAWKLGMDDLLFRANDDGEPGNSAGKPILGQITKYNLTDVLIVVVRYFGGTKLGVGGLINAYRTAASAAIENGTIVEKQLLNHYQLKFTYAEMNDVMSLVKELDLPNYDQQFELECAMKVQVALGKSEAFEKRMEDLENVKCEFLKTV